MKKLQKFFSLSACVLSLSCTSYKSVPQDSTENVAPPPPPHYTSLPPHKKWIAIQEDLHHLPNEIQKKTHKTFFDVLNNNKNHLKGDDKTLDFIAQQLRDNPKRLPIFPGVNIPLHFISPYDSYTSTYSIKAPRNANNTHSVVLLLGEECISQQNHLESDQFWSISIPSRPHMNYQLLSEGDFWNILEEIYDLYPQLRLAKTYLIGMGESSDAALLFANNYRGHFQGLAFSESRLGLTLPNLDHFPIVHFKKPSSIDSSPWGGKRLIDRLKMRNNMQAQSIDGGIQEAALQLISLSQESTDIAPYTFENYQYSQITPWLTVMSKKSERTPTTLSAKIVGEEIHVDAPNVKSLKITPSPSLPFFKKIKRLILNDRVFNIPIKHKNTLYIYDDSPLPVWKRKTTIPGGLVNFFRKEPLYILFQDQGAEKSFLLEVKNFAKTFSQLKFFGFPPLQAKLPIIALSQYSPESLPAHRIIAIGQNSFIKPILEKKEGYLPNPQKRIYKPLKNQIAFGIVYPPEQASSLKLALLLSAEDILGLKVLQDYYTSATSLYNEADFLVWEKKENDYTLLEEETFNSFWKKSSPSTLLIQTPPQKQIVWESYLEELLIQESRIGKMVITPLIDSNLSVPSLLTYESLYLSIPEKHFAVVTLKGSTAHLLADKLFSAMDNPVIKGFSNDLFSNDSSKQEHSIFLRRMKKDERVKMLVDSSALESLSPEETQLLDYYIFPYSLQEMLLKKISFDRENFGKDFLRLANALLNDT